MDRWFPDDLGRSASLDDKSPLDENYEIYSPRTNYVSPTSISHT